jgi:hypothetical protein
MVTTEHSLTLSIATAFGAYMLAAGAGGVINRSRWGAILQELRASQGLVFIAGVVTFTLGVVLILVHNIWSDPLAGFISLVGWVAALEGLILLAYPELLLGLSNRLMKPQLISPLMAFAMVLGGLLLLLGLTGTSGGG